MSGHSKWHTIRRTKGVLDQKRGQLFTKLGRDITMAAREGGGDPDMNFRLRLAVDKARAANMPMDNIQRAIDKATGKGSESALEEITYEGYANGGIAILVETATDNRNRTASEVRATFTKAGGNPGEPGSVSWMFEQKGLITLDFAGKKFDADDVMLQAIDAGADDVEVSDDIVEIYTDFKQLAAVRQALISAGLPVSEAEKTMRAKTTIQPDLKDALQALKLIERMEDLDDVQKVYSNLDITDEVAEQMENS
ncbi:YebC/PmpR family DNA-binding transcriptional regulator [Chloroflexia bacterium SDU3-3]|nr:YebC/PmpR family DNA-binding transcriptional regulator [Chloroflexia bacterium SDU3-3]